MMRLQGLLLFFAFLVGVLGATTPFKPKMCHGQAANVKIVGNAFTVPKEFCHWYISAQRAKSPLANVDASDLTAACECIVKKVASTTPVSFQQPEGFTRTCNKKNQREVAALARRQPKQFCEFWGNGADGHYRPVSPFSGLGMTNQEIYDGCYCYATAAATTTSVPASANATATATPTGGNSTEPSASNTAEPSASNTAEPSASGSTESSVSGSTQPSATPSATGDSSASATASSSTTSSPAASSPSTTPAPTTSTSTTSASPSSSSA